MLDQRATGKALPTGLDAAWDVGRGYIAALATRQRMFLRRAAYIVVLEQTFSGMTDAKLKDMAAWLLEVFRRGRDTDCHLNQAFALVREVASRRIGERHFPVQIAGALALDQRCVAEMATGEGKTLTATLAVTVAGWRGKGCHVITVNDYLAKRDALWMKPIYDFCGLKVAYIEEGMSSAERRIAYDADITYCTNKEAAADFLRDRLHIGRLQGVGSVLLDKLGSKRSSVDLVVQRGLEFALVDEADSVLIDEAVTPLIIATEGLDPEHDQTFLRAAAIAASMSPGMDYTVDLKYHEVELTDAGKSRLAELSSELDNVLQGMRRSEEVLVQALVAKEFYARDKQYIVEEGKVVIVDEFTGRLMRDRTWRDGLHQAVEAKENLQVNAPQETCARISFQRFFRGYRKLAGMTGTAREASSEFWQIYHLPVVPIPTNRPCTRKVMPSIFLTSDGEKWRVIIEEIGRIHETGQPILVGTRSIQASQHLSDLLKSRSLSHQVLNAIYHRQEAQIVAEAGQEGRITVATNMAGRGTDIKLGRRVAELGGLHVLAAELNESSRIDRQLFGRCARQGDPGSAQAIASLEDEYICRYAGRLSSVLMNWHGRMSARLWHRMVDKSFTYAQYRAERHALRQRKSVLTTDNWLDEHLGFAGTE